MSVFTTQGYKFRLVAGSGSFADRTQLDLFADEEIKVSNNITDLFDIGAVPEPLLELLPYLVQKQTILSLSSTMIYRFMNRTYLVPTKR